MDLVVINTIQVLQLVVSEEGNLLELVIEQSPEITLEVNGLAPVGANENIVESVSGLDTDNTDPFNPIVKISVDGISITGLGTPASPLISIGGGGGISESLVIAYAVTL